MEDVNKYVDSVINHYKNDVPFMFDTVEQYVISVFRDKIKSLKREQRHNTSKYSDSFINKQIEFYSKCIEEVKSRSLNEAHNIKSPYDRSKGKINQIIELCDSLSKQIGKQVSFDNTWVNHYKLTIDNSEFSFTTYNDLINALEIIKIII